MKPVLEFLKANAWLIVLAVVLVIALLQFVDPAPPSTIKIATGSEEGRYHQIGKLLQTELAKEGLDVELVATAGSSENLDLLSDAKSGVSLALVQSGVEENFENEEVNLHCLGSLYYEPIWIFRRSDSGDSLISGFEGMRIGVGEAGSGTNTVARYLLSSNGLTAEGGDFEILEVGGDEAVDMLEEGALDVAFFNVSAESETIQSIIRIEDVELMDVRRSDSYTARFPSLSSVHISEGLLDLGQNIPDSQRTTLASTATLVVNESFHPAFTPLVLETLAVYLKRGGILERPGEFPSAEHVGFELTKEADYFFEYGPPFLIRYLPFWAASLVDRLVIFIIPLLVVIIPLSKVAGPIYRWRIRSRIYKWYRHLMDTEREISEKGEAVDRGDIRENLDTIKGEIDGIEVPLSYADELYHLKAHVEYVSRRLEGIDSEKPIPSQRKESD